MECFGLIEISGLIKGQYSFSFVKSYAMLEEGKDGFIY
jgi:hypothetical protein